MNMLTVSNVEKRFGDKQVLKKVSFSVPENTIFGFVGQNGAGKTTTMKMILGLLPMDAGTILVNGEEVRYGNTKTNKCIGYLPDVPEFYSYMTPAEYLKYCGEITGMNASDIKSRTGELLSLVGLSEEKHRIKGFSRGMKQRLGIAQALLNRPKLLICDEPTSALDPVGRKEILDILVAAKSQTTVLFSTHILSDVERICDEIAFLHHGEIVLQGGLEEVRNIHNSRDVEIELEHTEDCRRLLTAFDKLRQTETTQLLLKDANQKQVEEIMLYLANHHIGIQRIEKQEPSLEALFMEVIGK